MNSKVLAGVIGLLVLGGGIFYFHTGSTGPAEDPNPPQNEDVNTSGDTEPKESVSTGTGSAGYNLLIRITESGVKPSRPVEEVGSVIQWRNDREKPVTLHIQRSNKEIKLAPGGTTRLTLNGITRYRVLSGEELVARASIRIPS